MPEKDYFCFSQRLAAWLMLHNIRLLYTTRNNKDRRRLVFVFEPDSNIDYLVRQYQEIISNS